MLQPCKYCVFDTVPTLSQGCDKVLQGYEKNKMKIPHMAWLSLMGSLVLGGGHIHLYTQHLS